MDVPDYDSYILQVYWPATIADKMYFGEMCKEIEQHTKVFCTDAPEPFGYRFYYYKLDDGVQAVSEIQRIFLKYSQAEAEQ